MEITYLGIGCVRLSGKNLNVLCDPYGKEAGLGKIAVKADVCTMSEESMRAPQDGQIVFDGPGEYEVKGVMITGVPAQRHIDEDGMRGTIFSITMDGVNTVVLGNVVGKLNSKQTDALGKVDVLIVPVGNHGLTLDAEGAAALIAQVEPAYVVPVHYADDKMVYPVPQDGLDVFLKEVGASATEPISKLKINARDLPEERQIVVLQRQGG